VAAVGAAGAAGLVEWPVLLPVGATVLGVYYVTNRPVASANVRRLGASARAREPRAALARGHRRDTRQQGHALRVRRSTRGLGVLRPDIIADA
jgi:hypothetical protein